MVDRLRVTELDFDTIKTNLKLFLKQQNEFTDYDFDGSGLSVLLDILAYNTHYNAYYLNMVANESFLDTAFLRASVVSHAKSLGYIPYSRKSPVATLTIDVETGTQDNFSLTIPRGYSFLSNQIDGQTYNFVVTEDVTVKKTGSIYHFENLEIKEGELISYRFVNDNSTNPKQVFVLPDENIDTSTLLVTVSPTTTSSETKVYNRVEDVLDVTGDSDVYFLQENIEGNYEIYFGNDVIGKKIPDGGVVFVSYLVTNGPEANKADSFIARGPLIDSGSVQHTNFDITVESVASGGAERETVEEIKLNSVSQYTTQNRLVTEKDYETFIKRKYPAVDYVSVWGGENENPPVYGSVFLSLKPKKDFFISETEKQKIIDDIIRPKSIITVDTVIMDPEFLYLLVENTVQYNKNKTTQSAENLKSTIRSVVQNYSEENLNKFNSTFVLSKLQESINQVDTNSIIGCETNLKIQKRFKPVLNTVRTYKVNFNTELFRGGLIERLISTEFDVFDSEGVRRTAQFEEIPDSSTGIYEIKVINPGSGFTETPTVTINGDGVGAKAIAKIVNGRIQSIEVTSNGIGYSRATATITGGSGVGATASVILNSRFGRMRTVYFDENSEKIIIDGNVGTIDYVNGIVNIDGIKILSVSAPDELIRLTVKSENTILSTNRNSILTIDDTDSAAIVVEMVQK